MIRLLFTLFLVVTLSSLHAAGPAFIVFYNSGKVVKSGKEKTVVLTKGTQLFATDVVTVPESAQLVLVCSNFSVIQLKTKGVYKISALLAKCNQQQTSASSAYFKYVWHSFAHAHTEPAKDPRTYMKTYGAASRGRVFKLAVDTINYLNGELRIGLKPTALVNVEVFNAPTDGKLILTSQLSNRINIDSIASKLAKPGVYYWNFATQPSPTRNVLKLWNAKDYQVAIQRIINNAVPSDAAERAYLTAFTLEEKRFLIEAVKYYQKALALEPNNQIFKDACQRFMP